MAGKTLQIAAIIAAVTVAGTVTVAVVASGDSAGQEGGFLGHLHSLVGQHLHGGGGQHDPAAQLVERLNLTPDQLGRFERVQEIVESSGVGGHESMMELHEELVTQLSRGQVGSSEIRQVIDRHIKDPAMASALTDELVALVNELDDTQRGILLEHLPDTGSGQGR
jgi:Spy/CpxP family protein refolding chaperone